MRKIAFPFGLSLFSLLLLASSPAFAIDRDFYTYGGFIPVTQAFTRLALVFSSNDYNLLFTGTTVLGILVGAVSMIIQVSTRGGNVSLGGWLIPIFVGVGLYLGLFVPKGNITVYDQVLNRFQTIGGIPDAIVVTAGVLNGIERGIVDIIETSAGPDKGFKEGAGGIGFKALESVRQSYIKDNHLRTSTIRYMKDCVTFELSRPGTTLSLDTLRNDTDDFLTELAKGVSPAIYTVYYDSANPAGVTKTCTEAWGLIRPIYSNPSNYSDAIKKVCGKTSFNPSNALELAKCKDLITSTARATTGNTVTPERLIQQRQISEILYTFYFQDDVETAMLMEANRQVVSKGIGTGIAMNEWVPIIKAIMTAIAIGMIPFLALFLPTPVVGKAASAMFGFFCFITIWGITDAVIHVAAMDYAEYAFEEMRQSSLGVFSMAAFPSLSEKMLGMFGIIRSSGIMLASVFTMMLVKFGGHALAMMAGSLSGAVSGAGAQAGALLTPEGTASAMNAQRKAAGLLEGMPQHSFANHAAAEAFNGIHSPVGNYNSSMNARNALEQAGQIPRGTSDAKFAEMKHNYNQQAGTENGQSQVTLGPHGLATMSKSEGRLAGGSTITNTSVGVGGPGKTNVDGAWGKAAFESDGRGGYTLTSASVNGQAPMSLTKQAAHIETEKAGHTLGLSKGWEDMKSQIRSDGLTNAQAHSYGVKLNNAETAGWDRVINDKSSFMRQLSKDQQEIIKAGVVVPDVVPVNGGYAIQTTGKDGNVKSFTVDESTGRSIKEAETDIREKAFTNTFNDQQGIQFAAGLAHKIGANEAAAYMDEASKMTRTTEATGADATTAFVRWYANDRGLGDSPEGIEAAGKELNHWATNSGASGLQTLHAHEQRFLKSGNYTWGDGKANVETEINATRAEVGVGMGGVQNTVMPAANEAGARTQNITPENANFSDPSAMYAPLQSSRVEGQKALDDAETLRDWNERKTTLEPFIQDQVIDGPVQRSIDEHPIVFKDGVVAGGSNSTVPGSPLSNAFGKDKLDDLPADKLPNK
jgi:conjugal transfer mating pair stabilization protein TraG